MSEETDEPVSVMSNPDYAGSLNDLVEELVRVELDATPVVEGSAPVDSGYREQVQARVTAAFRDEAPKPDLHTLLTSALRLWAERK